jgi:hypothetical protein
MQIHESRLKLTVAHGKKKPHGDACFSQNLVLLCWQKTRQSRFGTRQSKRRVATHSKDHTAKNSSAKVLCRVPTYPEHGKAFAVCLTARYTAKDNLTVSLVN